MYDHTLIHYPLGVELPAPWQPDWSVTPHPVIPDLPRRGVARAAAGTPIPAGCTAYEEPAASAAHREIMRRALEQLAEQGDSLHRELARLTLDNPESMDRQIRQHLGLAHDYARYSPLSTPSLDDACRASVRATEPWTSLCSCAVIRAAERGGYRVWVGIGSLMRQAGSRPSYEAAERLAIESSARERREAMSEARSALDGWHDDTPYYSATLATAAEQLPLGVRRGPVTSAERGVSWDLPVVAKVVAGEVVERHDERIDWDDDESRQALLERERAGQRRRKVEIERALEDLRRNPALAPIIVGDGLQPGAVASIGSRESDAVPVLGPVRMREDGACALALVRYQGRRCWMALGHFASSASSNA